MHRFALLSIFLLSCAGPTPSRTYADGVPMAPRAPAFDPVWESPTDTGHPGHVAAPLPRSPYSRELPQTPKTRAEDGLWSAEEPQAVVKPLTNPEVFGVVLPFPPDAKTVNETRPASACATVVDDGLVRARLQQEILRLSPRERACLIAGLYSLCASGSAMNLDRFPPEDHNAIIALRKIALEFANKQCANGAKTPAVEALARRVDAAWRRAINGR